MFVSFNSSISLIFLFFFLQKVKKSLGSAPKNRDGRVTGSKAFFFLGLIKNRSLKGKREQEEEEEKANESFKSYNHTQVWC